MKTGTKSLLWGVHQIVLHPILVAISWIKLYGWTWDLRVWIAFVVHDWGYWGKPNMDGLEGETHPETGAKIMHWLFDGYDTEEMQEMFPTIQRLAELKRNGWSPIDLSRENNYAIYAHKVRSTKWYNFTAYHSRYYAKKNGVQPSRLCYADKMAFVLTPAWFYIPAVAATGEIKEYMQRANRKTTNKLQWLLRAKLHTLEFVLEHYQGKPYTSQPQSADPLKIIREDTFSNEEINQMTGAMIRAQYKKEQNP